MKIEYFDTNRINYISVSDEMEDILIVANPDNNKRYFSIEQIATILGLDINKAVSKIFKDIELKDKIAFIGVYETNSRIKRQYCLELDNLYMWLMTLNLKKPHIERAVAQLKEIYGYVMSYIPFTL
jgi:DNA polymerase III delta prime subunit